MAKVPNGVETLPKISIPWVGGTNITDDRQTGDRQTDGRRHIANVKRSLKRPKYVVSFSKRFLTCYWWTAFNMLFSPSYRNMSWTFRFLPTKHHTTWHTAPSVCHFVPAKHLQASACYFLPQHALAYCFRAVKTSKDDLSFVKRLSACHILIATRRAKCLDWTYSFFGAKCFNTLYLSTSWQLCPRTCCVFLAKRS